MEQGNDAFGFDDVSVEAVTAAEAERIEKAEGKKRADKPAPKPASRPPPKGPIADLIADDKANQKKLEEMRKKAVEEEKLQRALALMRTIQKMCLLYKIEMPKDAKGKPVSVSTSLTELETLAYTLELEATLPGDILQIHSYDVGLSHMIDLIRPTLTGGRLAAKTTEDFQLNQDLYRELAIEYRDYLWRNPIYKLALVKMQQIKQLQDTTERADDVEV